MKKWAHTTISPFFVTPFPAVFGWYLEPRMNKRDRGSQKLSMIGNPGIGIYGVSFDHKEMILFRNWERLLQYATSSSFKCMRRAFISAECRTSTPSDWGRSHDHRRNGLLISIAMVQTSTNEMKADFLHKCNHHRMIKVWKLQGTLDSLSDHFVALSALLFQRWLSVPKSQSDGRKRLTPQSDLIPLRLVIKETENAPLQNISRVGSDVWFCSGRPQLRKWRVGWNISVRRHPSWYFCQILPSRWTSTDENEFVNELESHTIVFLWVWAERSRVWVKDKV